MRRRVNTHTHAHVRSLAPSGRPVSLWPCQGGAMMDRLVVICHPSKKKSPGPRGCQVGSAPPPNATQSPSTPFLIRHPPNCPCGKRTKPGGALRARPKLLPTYPPPPINRALPCLVPLCPASSVPRRQQCCIYNTWLNNRDTELP